MPRRNRNSGIRPLDPEYLAAQLAELAADLGMSYRPATTGQLSPYHSAHPQAVTR